MAEDTLPNTPLSAFFKDPDVRAAFWRAERDGTAPLVVLVDCPRILAGGAVVGREVAEA